MIEIPRTDKDIQRLTESINKKEIRGNPIVDTLQLSFSLYGDADKLTDSLAINRKLAYYCENGNNEKIEKYIQGLSMIPRCFNFSGVFEDSQINNLSRVKKDSIFKSIKSKLPIQIARFKNGQGVRVLGC